MKKSAIIFRALGLLSVATWIVLSTSGYRITWEPVAALIWVVFILSVSLEIYRLISQRTVRIALVLFWLLAAGSVALFFILSRALGTSDETIVYQGEQHEYKVYYTNRTDWAGPRYHRFEVRKERIGGLLKKTVDYTYPFEHKGDPCLILFERAQVALDTCTLELSKYH